MREMSRSLRSFAVVFTLIALAAIALSFAGSTTSEAATIGADTAPFAASLAPKECEDDCPAQL